MNIDQIKEFVKLEKEKKELSDKLDKVKKRIAELDPVIQEIFIENGLDQIKLNGRTVFMHKQIWAKIKNKESAIKALQEAGLNDFVNEGYNTNSLSSYLRELTEKGKPFPESFEGVIEANEVIKIKSTKS